MTLLIAILAVTNIALGYGLAIYFGHARAREARTVRAARQLAAEQAAVEVTWQEPRSLEPVVETVAAPVAAPIPPQPVVASPVAEMPAPEPAPVVAQPAVAATEARPAPVPVESVAATATSPEEDTLAQVEEVRAEIHDIPAPAPMVEALADSAEAMPAAAQDDAPNGKPVSKEALLESINAFQNQLKKQQELAKLHAVTSSPAPVAAPEPVAVDE